MQFDRDRSGTIEAHELAAALASFGYRLNPQTMGVALRRYSVNGRIAFDDFISLSIRVRILTGKLIVLYELV